MDNFEALWAYQTEDIKADAIANAIRRSPIRLKLEKTRDLILERQKQYKQIEVEITAMADRKDIIEQAVTHSEAQLAALREKYEANPPQTAEEVRALMTEVSHSAAATTSGTRILPSASVSRSSSIFPSNSRPLVGQLRTVQSFWSNSPRCARSSPLATLTLTTPPTEQYCQL